MMAGNHTTTDLCTGIRVGRWTVLALLPKGMGESRRLRSRWHCRCDCGVEKHVLEQNLVLALRSPQGGSRSCGCLAVERATRHAQAAGAQPSPEYLAWVAAKKRCSNPRNASYRHYGARGIRMCPAWAGSFVAFLRDMGRRPSPSHSLDRINPNGNYAPENCRWASPQVQARNRRCSRWYAFDGQQLLLGEVAARLGVTRDQARALERSGQLPAWRIWGASARSADVSAGTLLDLNDLHAGYDASNASGPSLTASSEVRSE